MSATTTRMVPAVVASTKRVKAPGGGHLGKDSGRDAKRWAAAVLEVLAGARTPTDAATALGVSVPRYYQIESRALAGLLTACEPKARGRGRSLQHEIEALRRQKDRLQQEVTRQQTLVRMAQRTIGLAAPTPVSKGNGKRKRRPVVRALSVARRLNPDHPATPEIVVSTMERSES